MLISEYGSLYTYKIKAHVYLFCLLIRIIYFSLNGLEKPVSRGVYVAQLTFGYCVPIVQNSAPKAVVCAALSVGTHVICFATKTTIQKLPSDTDRARNPQRVRETF